MGASLDLRKLLVYPIPNRALFTIEVILRISTAIEMMLILTGAAIGLLFNPAVPLWAPLWLAVFVMFNLFFPLVFAIFWSGCWLASGFGKS